MESALLGVILDFSVIIEAERQQFSAADFLKQIKGSIGDIEAALCSISIAELVHGIYRANTPERRVRRRAFLEDLKASVPIYPIAEATAELVGKIGAESSAAGVTIPFDDLLIAACAMERNYAIATRNVRHFEKIAGLQLVSI